MHESEELKRKLDQVVNSSDKLEGTEKAMWHTILSNLSDYQEEVLRDIAQQSKTISTKDISTVHCGISIPQKELTTGLHYLSVADDITYEDSDSNSDFTGLRTPEDDSKHKRDGKWYIIAVGYMDCEYDDLLSFCGRNRSYIGECSNGQFQYSLILKPTILQKEKELNAFFNSYPFEITTPYAPMLRRLVYIETLQEVDGDIDLKLDKNGLDCLRCGWRSVWNIEEPDSPVYVYNSGRYRFKLANGEYMILIGNIHDVVHFSGIESQNGQRYFDVITSNESIAKDSTLKIIVHDINVDSLNGHQGIILYSTPITKQADEYHRIYSRGDLTAFLHEYNAFVRFANVSTRYRPGLRVCAYERGYYLVFRNNKIGTKEYREALKYPKASEQQQQEILRQLSRLENSLSNISSVSYSDIESIKRDIEELKRKLASPSTAASSSEKEQQIIDILKNLAARVSAIESSQKSNSSNEEILECIRRIEADAENTKSELRSIHAELANKRDPVSIPQPTIPTPSKPVPQPRPTSYTPAPKTIINPTLDYVQSLIDGVTLLESNTSSISYELGKLKAGLLNVKKDGDFDDLEEIMNQIHDLIKKNVYDSDSKVSTDEWRFLEQFLLHSGYEPVPVKEGDSINPYRTYFERPIPATGGPADTIKQIQLIPFVLAYSDSGETEILKLCGKCTYYK